MEILTLINLYKTKSTNAIRRSPGYGYRGLRAVLILVMIVFSLTAFSQNITVSGTVTDAETGEAMIGLNVVIKGTTRGVATDLNGNYTVTDCPPNAVLIFSFMGYEPVEVAVQRRTTVNVSIAPSSNLVEDVVVIGYGTVNKRDVTGSVSSTFGRRP